ncbi:hypothetical protein LG047_08920 [Methylocystis sp. WRRC1]|uniref:hypothetical protein n=1 Tax=Methylocystis sp. WRRC1 TaxID=1732014 RepID=UPI001D15D1EA|nr:hypothetical protein [Methylocystis sp. WRRC1]MCC3245441.1 hypothetical protein [Methylocystis sp. WRRC1]
MRPLIGIRAALEDPDIFGEVLPGDSWAAWRTLLIAAMGEPLTDAERIVFAQLTGREHEPRERVDELWAIIGRRGGKTRAVAVLGAYLASLVDYKPILAPGERASLLIISASLWQAQKCHQYLAGIFSAVPALRKLVANETADTISLKNRIDIETRPASFRTIRGGTAVAIIADEVAFWRNENTANPDAEILSGARPSLATTNGPLICISSPYARRGELWSAYKRDYGPEGDPSVLVAQAPSRVMNPLLSAELVDRAYARDAPAAAAEYGAEFRADIEAFINREAVEACVQFGVFERAPLHSSRYQAFVDPAGGSGKDSFTLAISHREDERCILDAVREQHPPFSPDNTVAEFAALLKAYGVHRVTGDRYAGEWPREAFRKQGITYLPSEKTRSELYIELLPLINAGRVELLDHAKLVSQLTALERRTSRVGKDSIDHPPGQHDDVANACAGALVNATSHKRGLVITPELLARAAEQTRYSMRRRIGL